MAETIDAGDFLDEAADAAASLKSPWTVERHDEDGGSITYEVWCHKPYWRICSIPEWDNCGAKAAAESIVLNHNAALPVVLAWDAYHNRSFEPVERRAKEIYDEILSRDHQGIVHPWTNGGNSTKQDEARVAARRELRETPAVAETRRTDVAESPPRDPFSEQAPS